MSFNSHIVGAKSPGLWQSLVDFADRITAVCKKVGGSRSGRLENKLNKMNPIVGFSLCPGL